MTIIIMADLTQQQHERAPHPKQTLRALKVQYFQCGVHEQNNTMAFIGCSHIPDRLPGYMWALEGKAKYYAPMYLTAADASVIDQVSKGVANVE